MVGSVLGTKNTEGTEIDKMPHPHGLHIWCIPERFTFLRDILRKIFSLYISCDVLTTCYSRLAAVTTLPLAHPFIWLLT